MWNRGNREDDAVTELLPPDVSFLVKTAAASMQWSTPAGKAAFERGVRQIRAAFLAMPAGDEGLTREPAPPPPTPPIQKTKTTDPPSPETLDRLSKRERQEPTRVVEPEGGAIPMRDEATTVKVQSNWSRVADDDEIVDAEIIEE